MTQNNVHGPEVGQDTTEVEAAGGRAEVRVRRPVRRLLGVGLVDYLGVGLFVAFSAVYFTRIVGLSTGGVGLGLGLAGLIALGTAVPIGRLADLVGVRNTLVALHLARAAGTAGYAAVGEWWSFLVAVAVVTTADQSVSALTQAFVAELADGADRVRTLAAYRTVANLGISLGAPLGGLAIGLDDAAAFRAVVLVNAAAFVLVAALLATIPVPPARGAATRVSGWGALRDRRVWGLASIDTLLQLWLPVLNLGIPLWLTTRGGLSASWLGALYAVNTVFGVVCQMPAARLAMSVRAARRCQVAAGALLAAACVLLWSAERAPAAVVFPIGVLLLSCGEVIAVSAAWTLSYAVAPDDRRAEYLAAFGMGRSVGRHVLGPILITGLLQAVGGIGWGVLAALFASAGVGTLFVRLPPDRPAADAREA
ncbi:MFS transporter [Embleya sp. NPDC059237]|uniref:MFS transporter n=1 Tax=Embleya sp. NPDC059237 TaxID=3346784 RepID=UPI0036CD3549